jgi:hypothetical protein
VLKVWIDGHPYFDLDQDLKDRITLADRKNDLIAKEKAEEDTAKKKADTERRAVDKKEGKLPQEGAL